MTSAEIEAEVRARVAAREVCERVRAAAVAGGATVSEVVADPKGDWVSVRWPSESSTVSVFPSRKCGWILSPQVQNEDPERLLFRARRCLDILPALLRAAKGEAQ